MNLPISPAAAADALLGRRRIRSSLDEWCRFAGFEPALHHRLLNRKLEQIERGEIKNLAVFMPPGSAKSTYASVLFPPFALSRHPDWPIIAASHTMDLAEKWGRRVRGLISEHGPALGISLSETSHAAGRWALSEGGEYYAAGVGTAIAGFRAKLGLIDDPVRSREDADSATMRERVWDWYVNDFRTRLMPGARKILIQTRWHEDDLAGRALQNEDWEVISLPALAEPGDVLDRSEGAPLWTDGDYGYGAQLLDIRASVPPRTWSALYQQRPAPETGEYFRKEWFSFYDTPPPLETLHVYGASDYAVTAQGGDYTVHGVGGMDANGDLFILDLWRRQSAADQWVEAFCDLVLKWKPLGWAEEKGQIRAGVGPFLERRMQERGAFVAREAFAARGDKAVRAQSIRGRAALRGVRLPRKAPWLADFMAELMSFPAGVHDDQVDMLGLLGQLLDTMTEGSAPPAVKPRPRRDWFEFQDGEGPDEEEGVNWRVV
jgi:predicted phage terminase large subunit-like protein